MDSPLSARSRLRPPPMTADPRREEIAAVAYAAWDFKHDEIMQKYYGEHASEAWASISEAEREEWGHVADAILVRFLRPMAQEIERLRGDVKILQGLYDSVRDAEDVLFGEKDRPVGPPSRSARWLREERTSLRAQVARLTEENAGLKSSTCYYDEVKVLRARVAALEGALREVERHCPCGARPESPNTHPHVGGCPVYAALVPPVPMTPPVPIVPPVPIMPPVASPPAALASLDATPEPGRTTDGGEK